MELWIEKIHPVAPDIRSVKKGWSSRQSAHPKQYDNTPPAGRAEG